MENLKFEKSKQKITMSISIDPDIREDIIVAAKQEGISVSSYIEQLIRFAMPEKKKGKE